MSIKFPGKLIGPDWELGALGLAFCTYLGTCAALLNAKTLCRTLLRDGGSRKNSKQNQDARNESWEKERS